MGSHYLKLNDGKTEFVLFGTERDIGKVTGWSVSVGGAEILPSRDARNIGAFLDTEMKMTVQISNTIRACYCHLRAISKIRKYLTQDAIIKLCHAFITSRIDNMNALLYNLPDYQLRKIQLIQNNTARLIYRHKHSDHITPLLRELHWLPVERRIHFKILLLVYKCLHQQAPSYLTELILPYIPTRALRSADQELLQESRSNKRYGERAFSLCGPKLWNALPLSVRQCTTTPSFKNTLKTHLFKLAYGDLDALA